MHPMPSQGMFAKCCQSEQAVFQNKGNPYDADKEKNKNAPEFT